MTGTVTAMPKVANKANLDTEVYEASGLNSEDIRELRTTAKIGDWSVGANVPGNQGLTLYALFQGDSEPAPDHVPGDIRAYAFPKMAVSESAQEFVCFTFSRANGAPPVVEQMTRATFVDAVAAEWVELADAGPSVIKCIRCTKEVPGDLPDGDPAIYCAACGAQLPKEAEVTP